MFPTDSVIPLTSLVHRFTSPPRRTRGLGVPPSLRATVRPPPLASELKLQPPLHDRPLAPPGRRRSRAVALSASCPLPSSRLLSNKECGKPGSRESQVAPGARADTLTTC